MRWRSFELRPKGAPPISPEYRAKIEAGRPRLYAIAQEQYGLTLHSGPWGIDSRPALIGGKYAEAQGQGGVYHAAIFRAYWQEARSIEDRSVLTDIAREIGLDPTEFQNALTDPTFDEAVSADVNLARAYGLNSVPALIFNDTYLVAGAQPYEFLVQALAEIAGKEGE